MSQRNRMGLSELDSNKHIFTQWLTEYVEDGINSVLGVGQNVAEFCGEDEDLKEKTREIMRSYISMESEIKHCVEAVDYVLSMDADTDSETNRVEEFEGKLRELKSAQRHGPNSHVKYIQLEEDLASIQNVEEQLQFLRHSLLSGTEDEDVALTQAEVNTKCPYTGQTMTDPVRNKLCGHVYEKEGILGHIKAKKNKAKCPVGGCGNKEPLKEDHLEEHRDLKRYITLLAKLKSQRR